DFSQAKFLEAAEFCKTEFRRDHELLPGLVFSLNYFRRPDAVIFHRTYLGQALFHNCDVSRLTFSSVEWRTRKRSSKRMLFEEEVELIATDLRTRAND